MGAVRGKGPTGSSRRTEQRQLTRRRKRHQGPPSGAGESGEPQPERRREAIAVQRALQQRVESHLKGNREAGGIAASLSHVGAPVQLPIPVRIWLEDESGAADVQEAVKSLLDSHGFTVVRAYPAQQGSWRRSLIYRLRRVGSSEEMRRRLEKIERGIELQLLTKNQAQVDQAQGDAVAKLLVALEASPTALVQIGSVLIVKIDGVPLVRNLTQPEIAMLDRDPSLLDNPRSALCALNDAAAASESQEGLPAGDQHRQGGLPGPKR